MSGPTIAFDVTSTITGATGMARYARELSAALERSPGAPTVRRFAAGRAVEPPRPGDPPLRRVGAPLRIVGAAWDRGRGPAVERLVGSVDSVHAAGPVLPTARAPVVAVVHDVAPLDHPELHPPRLSRQLRRYLERLRQAAAVIAVSRATAERVAPWAGGAPVHVVPNGRTELPPPTPPPWRDRPYVLAVGAPVARKAFDAVLRAVDRLDRPDLGVVVVGPPGPEDPALRRLAEELGLGDRFRRAVGVTDAELAGWYDHAAAVAVPSVGEGFSLPLVEAQAAGAVVVASDLAVHREVAGTAALFVPAGDEAALAEGVEAALADAAVVDRARVEGPANAARFTWEAAAAATLAVHASVGALPPGG